MGILRRVRSWLAADFASDETPPRPIAEVLLTMANAGILPRVGRNEALSVAPVLRGRNLICSISTLPLVQYGPDLAEARLSLLEQIDPDVPNVVTLAQTVEDLLFEGISWWRIIEFGADGYPTLARHLDHSAVSLLPPGGHTPAPLPGGYDPRNAVVYVDGYEVPAELIIRFDSPNPGLLHAAGRSVHRAVLLDQTSALYANNPRPLDYFTPGEGADPADDDEVAEILADWEACRKKRSTAYVPASMKYNSVDTPTPADLQLVELQKQAYLSIANALGLDPEDLGISTTTRTYQNGVDRRQDRINDTLSPYMRAITDRLSMGDVTKRGYRVLFNLDDYLRADPMTRWGTYKIAKEIGAMDEDEIRAEESMPPLTTAQRARLAPAPVPAAPPQPLPDNVRPIRAAAGFDADDTSLHLSFDTPAASFTVDAERRIIEGIAVPYGPDKIALKNGRRWRFQQGSLIPAADQSRNKLLRDHDFSQPQGPLQYHEDRADGMFVRYKVGRGPDGDRTLAEAEDKVRDGFSIGVDIHEYGPDPLNPGAFLVAVGGARWNETSVLAVPAFDDARVSRVTAGRDNGGTMDPCATCGQTHADGVAACATPTPPAAEPEFKLSHDQFTALLKNERVRTALAGGGATKDKPSAPAVGFSADQMLTILGMEGGRELLLGVAIPAPEQRQVVNPTRPTGPVQVTDPAPYRFDRKGNLTKGAHDFSSDLIAGHQGDGEALTRAQDFMRSQFEADERRREEFVNQADAATLNPSRQRPDMYVDQREFEYPIWNVVNKGTIPDATPFVLPKFNTSSGLVAAHVENNEPTPGTFTATAQTITPSAVSGKVEISREAWDQGGNPQLSGLIWRQMIRAWFEALEASAVALLEAAAPTTITITTAAADSALEASITSQLAPLQFVRGGFRMRDAFSQVDLYKALIAAKDSNGRKLFPVIGAQNATGTTAEFFSAVLVAGLVFRPAWALAASGVVSANSYLFDRGDVSGWATAPQRLTFENISVAKIHVGIWGYKALAITDLTGVRRLAFDPV